jgi:hypothetical protein
MAANAKKRAKAEQRRQREANKHASAAVIQSFRRGKVRLEQFRTRA